MKLRDCLSQARTPALKRLRRHYGVVVGHDCGRANLIKRLCAAPLQPAMARELGIACQTPALIALQVVAGAGGQCDRSAFERAFGPCAVPPSQSIPPYSPAWLTTRGLLFVIANRVVLPEELLAAVPPPASALPVLDQDDPTWPLYDLAVLLVAAQAAGLAIEGRGTRLRSRVVHDLALRCATPAAPPYIHFLVELALATGLLQRAPSDVLRPGPYLAMWTARGPAEQLDELWRSWCALLPRRRRDQHARRMPCRDCRWLRDELVHRLAPSPLASLTPPAGQTDHSNPDPDPPLHLCLAPADLALLWAALPCVREGSCHAQGSGEGDATGRDPFGAARTAALSLLAGPLRWLDLCRTATASDGVLVTISLPPRGAALLANEPWPLALPDPWRYAPPDDAVPPRLCLAVPPEAECAALLRLGEFAAPLPSARGLWRIESHLVERHLRAGGGVEPLVAFLEHMTARPLPRAWRGELVWLSRIRAAATVTPVLLVESPAGLPPTRPPLSRALLRTLSPRAAVVHPGRMHLLRRALAGQDIDLVVNAEDGRVDQVAGAASALLAAGPRAGQQRVALAVGLRLLHALQDRGFIVPTLPWPPADALLACTEDEIMATRLWSQRLLDALDERHNPADASPADADPAPPTGQETPEVIRLAITHALEQSLPVRLCYATGGQGVAQWRLVEPHRLEAGDQAEYLRAYCHLAGAERTFRLDRILRCEPAVADP